MENADKSQPQPLKPHLHPTVRKYLNSPEIAYGYDDYFLENRLFNFDCQFLASVLKPRGEILDAGCGTGRHMVFLHKLGFKVTGLDLSPHFLQAAAAKLRDEGVSKPRLIRGDLINPPQQLANKYDGVILMFSVLGMVQGAHNRELALTRLRSLLKPGGQLVAHFHNREYSVNPLLQRVMRIRQKLNRKAKLEEGDSVMHNYRGLQDLYLHAFSLDELQGLFEKSGYSQIRISGINSSRNGSYSGKDLRQESNGFFVCAQR